jgi:hypothetical protein
MSIEAAQVQYRQAFVDQFEGKVSVFRTMATTKETVMKGNQATFLVAGSGTDTAVTRGTNGQIPYGNPTNSQLTATLVEKHAPYELTGFNVFASQGDQKAIMRQASMNVINRDIDLVAWPNSPTPRSIPAPMRPPRLRWSRRPRATSATTTSR